MAHYKRKRPRTSGSRGPVRWRSTPSWWNILHHSRPRRRLTKALLRRVKADLERAGDVPWPQRGARPHRYYW